MRPDSWTKSSLSRADERGLSGGDRLALCQRVVLIAAAADRPHRAPVGEDEHLRARPVLRRAGRSHDRHQRGGFAAL
jgi:hypothetical protein